LRLSWRKINATAVDKSVTDSYSTVMSSENKDNDDNNKDSASDSSNDSDFVKSARAYAAYLKTPEGQAEYQVWIAEQKLFNSASKCRKCGGEIGPKAAVYYARKRTTGWFGYGFRAEAVCKDCRGGDSYDEGAPCYVCSRRVYLEKGARHDALRVFCSPHCKIKFYGARDKDRRMKARWNLRCAVCKRKFTPDRADAKFCSSACKQKAYRQRSK
jgi:hypothetical protein